MDRQAIYNRVRDGLKAQGGLAMTASRDCYYRAPNGNRCALGLLIPDELYKKSMEGDCASTVLAKSPELCALFGISEIRDLEDNLTEDVQFLNRLQGCHDTAFNIADALYRLARLAISKGLTP